MRVARVLIVGQTFGILLGRALEGSPLGRVVTGCLIAVAGLLLVGLVRRASLGVRRIGLGGFSLGVAALIADPHPRISGPLVDGAAWVALGRVDAPPRRVANGVSVAILVGEVRPAGQTSLLGASGRVRISAPSFVEPVGPGDTILVETRFSAPGRSCNPGACDGRWRAAADGVDAYGSVDDPRRFARIVGPAAGWRARLHALRVAMAAAIQARLPPREAALVTALVVGERGGLDGETETRFRAAGVTHLLSVSGLHLAFAAGLLYALLRFVLARVAPQLGRRRPRDRWAAILALPIVAAYTELTGAEIATLRAAIIVGVAFSAVILGRRARGVDALAFAALVLLLACPASLFDPSFQLSFVAALATLIVGRGASPTLSPSRHALVRGLRLVVRTVRATLTASLAATLATAPLTALHFSELAPAGAASNAVAIPLTEMAIVPLGLVGALLGAARHGPSGWILDVAGFLASLLLGFVDAVASVAPVWPVPAPSTLSLLVAGATLAWIAAAEAGRGHRLLVGLGIVGAVLGAEAMVHRLFPALEIVFLDVGQGDSAVILVPGHGAIVIDGGGGRSDPGARVLVPFLRRRGVRRVERLILSHPHPDHSGGLPAVLAQIPVDEIWTNGQDTRDPATLALLGEAGARGIPVRRPRHDQIGDVTLEVLAPRDAAGAIAADPLASENDNSLVVILSYAGRRILFAGDVERDAEATLLGTALAQIDVLKVPHHGSRTSSTAALLDRLRPRLAVASLADGNRYRFPHPDVVARYRARGIALYRTDTDGAVRVRITSGGELAVKCTRPSACDYR